MKLVFDIEADNLLNDITQVWCIVARDVDSGKVHTFPPEEIPAGLELLKKADILIGHNIIDYDLRALKKLHGFQYQGEIIDTLVSTRTIWPNIIEHDFKVKNFPKKLMGSHSLKAWGYRLGERKDTFGDNKEVFEAYSQEMMDYCVQDVKVNLALYHKIKNKNFSPEALALEHKLHTLLIQQEEIGFPFHVWKAISLYATLEERKTELEKTLVDTFEPTIVVMKTKTKEIPFNPASRQQIGDRLMKLGWNPQEVTATGQPKVDESVLATIDLPEAKLLTEFLMLNKRIGQLATGKQAWLKLQKGGRIHGRVNHMGAVTSRCTAANPNLQQVPSSSAPFGKECRSLFYSPSGYILLGADASGLELRCLAHYMAAYDGGEYAREVVNGDIHTKNQESAGLPTRDNAKTFIYGFLYGAGDEKIGKIINKGGEEGKRIKEQFLRKTPALKKLREAAKKASEERGWLKGLDNRIIPIRHSHAALNTLLQSAGAIICKTWYVRIEELLRLNSYTNEDVAIVGFIHDEVQILVRDGLEESIGKITKEALKDVEKLFNFRCPLDSEYKHGKNWSETH